MISFSIIQKSQLEGAQRLDAEYYQPEYLDLFKKIGKGRYTLIEGFAKVSKGSQITETFSTREENLSAYVSIKDIRALEAVSQEYVVKKIVKRKSDPEDILIAVTGATIGKSGINSSDEGLAFSGDLVNLGIDKSIISPYYVLAYLNTETGFKSLLRFITGSTNMHLSPEDIKKIPIPRFGKDKENFVINSIKNSISNAYRTRTELSNSIRGLEAVQAEENVSIKAEEES